MASIPQIIGKINPWLYAENGKELLRKYGSIEKILADEVKPKNLGENKLVYDSPSETLEPVYFYLLDLMNNRGMETEKLFDNFASTPGSGHFSELGTKATVMQQNASKIMGDVNNVLRSVLNIIYDLKDFKIRLKNYEDLKSKESGEAALLTLKQIWMDRVDIQKGNSSIKAMALGQAGFQTLLDAFLVSKNEKDVDKLDLNERIKRILKPRIQEFNVWVKESEKELKKRYALEKSYLRSQVNSVKLYARWAKPYLKAAQQLEMSAKDREPALVKAFNTILLEMTLLGKTKIDPKEAAIAGKLPLDFQELKAKREYYSCIFLDFRFRGIPQRAGQQSHYVFGGRAEVRFIPYALNKDELKMLDREIDNDDLSDVLKLIEGATTESLGQMQKEINLFLDEKDGESSGSKKEGSNPFLAIIGYYNKKSEKEETKKPKSVETLLRFMTKPVKQRGQQKKKKKLYPV